MIPKIQNTTPHYINKFQQQPNFTAMPRVDLAVSTEKKLRSVEFAGRKIINRISELFQGNKNNEFFSEFLNSNEKSEEFINLLTKINKTFSNQKEVEINIESNRIHQIASSNQPRIFIMNHDNQRKDPKMLAFFNTLLNYEYMEQGLAKTCPRPRIILNEDIILSMKEENQNIFKKLGAVPIDASLYSGNSRANAKTFMTLLREFINGNVNIFIFPEGKNSIFKNRPLAEKFQLGAAEIVAKIADKLPEVRITPLGFAYGKNLKTPDSIHIGEDIIFKKAGKHIEASIGNIKSNFANPGYKDFFASRENAILTNNSIPVEGKSIAQYIGGVMCENLRICREEAIAAIKNK